MNIEKGTVAVIGGGGREHVLVATYAKSPYVERILVFPGNDYMSHPTIPIVSYPHIITSSVSRIV